MFRRHLQSAATITAIAAVALSATTGIASARGGPAKAPGLAGVKSAKFHRGMGGGTTLPPHISGGTTSVALEAFPTGGKGSGSEETCGNWTTWLREDQGAINDATTTTDIINASNELKADKDAAMDAGCVVID